MLGDSQFFSADHFLFGFFPLLLNKQKKYVCGQEPITPDELGKFFNYFSCTIHIGSNCYMDTGVCDLEVSFIKANSI